jgi:hypothetical protein
MDWAYPFQAPITLLDGRQVHTLADARDVLCGLPENHRRTAHWRYAGDLLFQAAFKGEKYSVMDARAQMTRDRRAASDRGKAAVSH